MLTDCQWLIEGKILCIFWEKCQGASVDIHTIFKNPDIYNMKYFADIHISRLLKKTNAGMFSGAEKIH